MRTTEKDVAAAIRSAKEQYEACWKTLAQFKSADDSLGAGFLEFQANLGKALHGLSNRYHMIHKEKAEIVRRKGRLSEGWVRRRLRTLKRYSASILESVGVGKGLGDAFAWFFYQREEALLRSHVVEQRSLLPPPGLGGAGEIEFIKKFKGVGPGPWFLLYHGMTSFLRLGDVSLIELKDFRVVGIGDFKTRALSPTRAEITLHTVSSLPLAMARAMSAESARARASDFKADPRIADRAKRQFRRIANVLRVRAAEAGPMRSASFQQSSGSFAALGRALGRAALSGLPEHERVEDGLVLLAIPTGRRGSASVILEKRRPPKPKMTDELVKDLLLLRHATESNSLRFGELQYGRDGQPFHMPGMTPLFWWPVKSDHLKAVVFKEIFVMSLYNPAHLISKLRSLGFEVQETGGRFQISLVFGPARLAVESFEFFLQVVQRYLLGEEAIVAMIQEVAEQAQNLPVGPPTRIEMHLVQDLINSPFFPKR